MDKDYLEELFKIWEENCEDSRELHHALTEIYPETCAEEQEVLLKCTIAERRNAFKAGVACMMQFVKFDEKKLAEYMFTEKPFQEEWRKIDKFPNYSVSNYGRVRNNETGYLLHFIKDKDAYPQVSLRMNKKSIHKSVHRLVAEAFIPNPEKKPYVNHIDGNRQNPRVDNLEWVTQSENVCHAYATGLIKSIYGSKSVIVYKNGERFAEFVSLSEASITLHISPRTINKFAESGKTYKGYIFVKKDSK